jgi:Transposase/DDE superfamily endonuclease
MASSTTSADVEIAQNPQNRHSNGGQTLLSAGGARTNTSNRYTFAQRVQCLTLLAEGYSGRDILAKTGVTPASQTYIKQKAYKRGFNPAQNPRILDEYVVDGVHTGRPKEILAETEDRIVENVCKDRAGREKSAEYLAYESGISCTAALRILHKYQLSNVKPTRKPGLNAQQRARRLKFALEHQNWSLEDWKRVIWSDETSVILGQRRGAVRLWRRPNEAYEPTVIRNRWKGFSEFMFWGCFSWDKKGPYHIWEPEIAQERIEAEKEIQQMNNQREEQNRKEWELSTAMRRMNLRERQGGRTPTWRFNKTTGKLIRGGKGGIDWYRYWKLILEPKLIPFALECVLERSETLVQEDNAPAHAHPYQKEVFDLAGVQRMLWPGNSPDLNAIEPAWFWLKRRTTARGAPPTKQDLKRAWRQAWQDMPQEKIQQWIAAIPDHIQEIIKLEGGNEYKEGVQGYKRSWKGLRIKGQLSQLQCLK